MILFIVFMITLLIMFVISGAILLVGGSAFIVTFGDLIVFVLLMAWICKRIFGKKKGDK